MALSKLTYNSLNVTAAASKGIGFDSDPDALQADYSAGAMTFIKKLTASSSATLSFVDGSASVVLDNTYKEYIFTWKNMHPATDNVSFQFNGSDDDSSHSYDVTKTTTFFQASHNQAGDTAGLAYEGSQDLAQGTGFANLLVNMGNDNDKSANGYLHLFNPSSTTFVKHFISVGQGETHDNYQNNVYTGGYFNTTADITAIQFKFSSGNIDAGDICLYGIS
jgi:hypothetical protein